MTFKGFAIWVAGPFFCILYYYNLIKKFYDKTGVPILLNTSFNENEPIVNTPAEAYDCFARTSMDMVVMGNVVVTERS